MVNGEKPPVRLVTADASSAIGFHDLLSKAMARFGPFLQADRAVFFGGQFLLATVPAQPSRCQFIPMSLRGTLTRLAALLTQFRRCIAFFAAIGASHGSCIVADCGGHIKGAEAQEVAAAV
jgi:hypothetical protein